MQSHDRQFLVSNLFSFHGDGWRSGQFRSPASTVLAPRGTSPVSFEASGNTTVGSGTLLRMPTVITPEEAILVLTSSEGQKSRRSRCYAFYGRRVRRHQKPQIGRSNESSEGKPRRAVAPKGGYFSNPKKSELSVHTCSRMSQSGCNSKNICPCHGLARALGSSMVMSICRWSRSARLMRSTTCS